MAFVLLKLGERCNNSCRFCHIGDKRADLDTALAHDRLRRCAAQGFRGVWFSGGEPSLRADLPALVHQCRALGMHAAMVSNARMPPGGEMAAPFARAGLQSAQCSLHGGSAEVHDALVRAAGAFDQSIAGIRAFLEAGVGVTVNTVLCRQNLGDMPLLFKRLRALPLDAWKLSFCEPKGYAALLDRAAGGDSCVPRLTDAAKVARSLLEGPPPAWARRFDGIPPCVLPEADRPGDLLNTGITAMWNLHDDRPHPTDMGTRMHGAACARCRWRSRCPGFYREYLELWGEAELRPRSGPVSNSFDFALTERVRLVEAPCPAPPPRRAGLDPLRDLLVADDDGAKPGLTFARRARADTRDFSLMEMRRLVHDDGQVYRQNDAQAAVSDFARQICRLIPAEPCRACPDRALSCPGVWRPESDSSFARLLAQERRFLESLHGRVLDVGCGVLRHEDVIADRHARGLLRYHAIDPQAGAIEALAARHGDWTLRRAAVEDLPPIEDAPEDPFSKPFDVILVLRSHNHFRDPRLAYRRLAERLAEGGRLVIADNGAFALVREAAVVSAARSSESGALLEHFRNDSSAQARGFLEDLPLRLLKEHPVRRGGPNQWQLIYQREPARTAHPQPAGMP